MNKSLYSMELTDREKLIIATLCVRKQNVYLMGDFKRTELVKEFSKSLEIIDKEGLYIECKFEEDQFKAMLHDIEVGQEANFDGTYSSLDNREKYIFYNVSMILVKDLPLEVSISIKELLKVILGIKQDQELLEQVLKQFNETLDYIVFVESKV